MPGTPRLVTVLTVEVKPVDTVVLPHFSTVILFTAKTDVTTDGKDQQRILNTAKTTVKTTNKDNAAFDV